MNSKNWIKNVQNKWKYKIGIHSIFWNWIKLEKKRIVGDIDITFFAKHSGSILGMTRHSINGHWIIFWYLSKKHLSRVIKLNPLGRYHCVASPIWYQNALWIFDIDIVHSKPWLNIHIMVIKKYHKVCVASLFLSDDAWKSSTWREIQSSVLSNQS